MKHRSNLLYLLACLLFLSLFAQRAEALVYCVTNVVDYHQQAPTGTLAQSGWQQTVMIDCRTRPTGMSNFLGTVIFSNALLTADHITEIKTNDTFILEGTHTLTSKHISAGSDLAIWFFTPSVTNQAHIARLNIESDIDTNALVVYQGCGTERGALVTTGTITNGWKWFNLNSWGTRRWGVNQTFAETDDGLYAIASFDNNGDPDECMLSRGDSGGPGFIKTGSGWKVAMVNYGVDPMIFTVSTNPVASFYGALYDCAGLYYLDGSAWKWVSPANSPAPCLLACSRTSQRIAWLTNTVAGLTFPADLGLSWLCQTNHPSAAQAASGLWFDLVVTNVGPYTARDIAIDLAWPSGLHICDYSATQGLVATNRWSIPALGDGSSATLHINTVVWNATPYWGTNNATIVTSDKPDRQTENNTATCPIYLPATATVIRIL
jgi:Domain of unknown function DUF11